MGLAARLWSGDHHRRSRFHDEKGNLVNAGGMVYAPLALLSAAAKKAGWRAERPMISYRAAREIARLLSPTSTVVEFGSGFSTPWLARRCASLVSFEDDPAWHALVTRRLRQAGLVNVDCRLRPADRFADVDDLPDGSIDFALVDGTDRDGCIAAIVPKLRPGGVIYLDNSDKDVGDPRGDLRRAEARLIAAAQAHGASLRWFTDFSPTNFFAEQGLMAVFPRQR